MKKTLLLTVFALIFTNSIFSQIGSSIPIDLRVDWRNAGYRGEIPTYFENYIEASNYDSLQDAITAANNYNKTSGHEKHWTLIHIPEGTYTFSQPIKLFSRICLRGDGADKTFLKNTFVDQSLVKIEETNAPSPIKEGELPDSLVFKKLYRNYYDKSSKVLTIPQEFSDPFVSHFQMGDYIEIIVENNTSSWHGNYSGWNPQYYVGQIVRIAGVIDQTHYVLDDDISYTLDAYPDHAYLRRLKLKIIEEVGIEDLNIKPTVTDITNSNQYQIIFKYAANCWMSGVMSEYPSTSHVDIEYSTGIEIRGCYFHDAQSFTENGNGYGIVVNCHSTNCLIEDNVFRRLRHAMIVTTGANRNVFGYNYSSERIQTELNESVEFTTRMADLVCHGHYPYANLFEGNVCDYIDVDNSHEGRLNGDYNTFFRNRVLADEKHALGTGTVTEYGGIQTTSGRQNVFGNTLQDIDDQNYVRGTNSNYNGQWDTQTGDAPYSDISYYHESRPAFISNNYTWPTCGTRTPWGPNYGITSNRNPARDRFTGPNIPEAYTSVKSRGKIYSLTLTSPQTPEDGQFLTGDPSVYYNINDQNISSVEGMDKSVIVLNAIAPANATFIEWSDGNTSNPRNYTITGNGTIYVKFKKVHMSDNRNAFANSGQRKFIRTSDGCYHLVYESVNKIWYERSTDGGVTWSFGNNGKPINTNYGSAAKHPAVDYFNNQVYIIWEEQSGTNYVVRLTALLNGLPFGPTNIIPFQSHGTYSEDIWPEIAIKDNYYAVIAIRRKDSYFKGLEVHYMSLPGDGTAQELVSGPIPGTDQNTGCFTLATDRSSTDKYHIAWEQGNAWNSSIQYARFNFTYQAGGVYAVSNSSTKESSVLAAPVDPEYLVMNVLRTVNVSNATSNTANFLPSMIGATDGTARIAFKGYEEYEPEAGDGWYYTLLVNPDNTSWIPYLNRYGSQTFSPQISAGSETYFVGWTEPYGNTYKTICTDASTLRNMETVANSSGMDMQINNGGTRLQQFSMGFNSESSTLPYSFKRSDAIGTIVANKKLPITNGRGVYLTKDQQQLFFIIGNVNFDGEDVSFTEVKDTVRLEDNLKKVNNFLQTEPFSLKINSTFSFAVRYGSRDSAVAKNNMKEGQFASFKVEMIDDASGCVIGSYLDEKLDKDNLFRFKESVFKVNSNGIGSKLVRLRLSVNENMKSRYTISEMLLGNGISLSKSLKEVELGLNGSLEVKEYSLSQNYPNPFNPTTVINYALPKASKVSLRVYDILGKEVATLVNGYEEMGKYSVQFNAYNIPSGIYFYEIRANDFVKSGKMLLLK